MVDFVELEGDTSDRMDGLAKEFKGAAAKASAFGTYPVILANTEGTDSAETM